uniref:Isoform 2 of Putative uncharacterized protein encoded by LINC00469 n=1 Tax=Homo sapiens TaxID=9606 RepID=Q8N7U9-2
MTSSAPTLPDVTIRNVSRHIQMSLMGKGEPPWLCRLQLEPLLQAMEEQQLGNLEARWEVEKHGNEVSGSTSKSEPLPRYYLYNQTELQGALWSGQHPPEGQGEIFQTVFQQRSLGRC